MVSIASASPLRSAVGKVPAPNLVQVAKRMMMRISLSMKTPSKELEFFVITIASNIIKS